MVTVGVYDKSCSGISESLKKYFQDQNIKVKTIDSLDKILSNEFNVIVLNNINSVPEDVINKTKFINIHPSLLPAFSGEKAIEETFSSGVKVGGVTIHSVEENSADNKIIAQYPVLIGVTTHIDEYTEEINKTIEKLLPPVVDSLINDRVFDFLDLFKTGCRNSCSSCSGCGKK